MRERAPNPDAGVADRARPAGSGAVGARAGRQICGPYPALPAIGDLRTGGCRTRLLDARRLGRPGHLAVAAAGRAARGACLRRHQGARRRHAGAGARSRPRPHQKGRLWVYVRDDRPCADVSPPAAVFFYTPDRKGERPAEHLARFSGFLQADAYAGFDKLYGERIVEVACWAHLRRKIFDVHESTKSQVAADALQKIGELYAIEKAIRGEPPDRRRDVRQEQAKPRLVALCTWFEAHLARLPPKGGLAQAIRYALGNRAALVRYADDGRLEIDNNRAENTLRGVALGRKNWLFAGSDNGG